MIKPITPDEADSGIHIPDFVIEVFNQAIQERWNGVEAIIRSDYIVDTLVNRREK